MARYMSYRRIICSILTLLLMINSMFFSSAAASVLSLPTGLKEIGEEAFYGDASLDHVDVPQGTERIGDRAFANSSLKTISLPDSIKTIGTDALPAGVIAYAHPGSDAWNWCIEHDITLAYIAPSGVSLDQRGTVTVSVSEPRAHTVMLGIYHKPNTTGSIPRMKAAGGVSDVSASGTTLLTVLPFSVEAGSTTLTADVSSLIYDSGSYYVKAKTVSGIAETNAYDLGQGDAAASNEIIYEKPSESVGEPQNVRWDDKVYGRATWEDAEKAVGYQVTLFSGDNAIATRNINTTHFNFSTEWLDLSDLDEVASKQYRFSVIGLSENIMTVSNSEPVYCDAILQNPDNKDEVRIVTDPATKYVSLGSQYTVSLNASGIGLTYDWFKHGDQGIEAIKTGSEDPFITLTADQSVSVYAVVHDVMGNEAQSETATITVVDDTPVPSLITRQPQDCIIDSGDRTNFGIEVDLSERYPYWRDYKTEYKWLRVGDTNERVISDKNHADFSASLADNGMQVYCHVKVTSPTGAVICEEDSESVTLTVRLKLITIIRDLESEYYGAGQRDDLYIVTRSDTGTEVRYQWLYKMPDADDYSEWPDFNTSFFDTKDLTDAHDGMKIKGAITATRDDLTGYLESTEATIHMDHLPATGVEIYPESNADVDPEHMMPGEYIRFKASLTPEYSDSPVRWSSSDPTVAAVDNGWVTANKQGRATIIASADGHSDSYEVNVDRYCVKLNPNEGKFPDGTTETKTLKPIAGESIDLPVLSKGNDTFLGWEKGETIYSRSYTPTESCLLLAVWESTTDEEDETLQIKQDLAPHAYAEIGTDIRFEVVGNGAKILDYQWYSRMKNSDEWVPLNNGTTFDSYRTSLEIESEGYHNGWQFKVVLTGKKGTVTSNICTLTTGTEPTQSDQTNTNMRFVTQPVDTMVKEGNAAVFTAAVNTVADYQWQEKVNDRWEDIADATSGRLELTEVTSSMGGKTYRCVVTAGEDVLISSEAKLKVMRISITKTAGEEYPVADETVSLRCDYEIFGEPAQNQEIRWISENVQVGSLSENQGSSVSVTIGQIGETDIIATVRGIEEAWQLKVDHAMVTAYATDGAFDGGTAEKSVRMTAGLRTTEQITDELGTPKLDSYTFEGWSDTPGGTAMASVMIGEGTALYAVWKRVTVYASSIHIQQDEAQPDLTMLVPDDEIQFIAMTEPEETDDDLIWSSSNPEVATVNQEGTVTILKTGTATITVQAKNASDAVDLEINHLKVVLDANGGIFSDGLDTHEERAETIGTNLALYTVPAETPTRENYQFKDWKRDGQAVSGEIVIRGNTTLTASWEGKDPKIIKDLDKDYYPKDENVFYIVAEGIDLHYQWQTRMSDTGTWTDVGTNSDTYAPELTADNNGMQIRCVVEDREYSPATTAYSRIATFHWEVHPISVNIGKVSGPDDLVIGDRIVLRAVTDPENCTDPVSWTSEDENIATVIDGTVTITGFGQTTIKVSVYDKEANYDITVNHVKVTLDANGGQFADETAKKTVRMRTGNYDPMPEFDTPVWDGSEFKGWNTDKTETPLTSINLQNNQTLYAVWERIPVHAESLEIQRKEETPDINLLVPGDVLHYTAVTDPTKTDDPLEWLTSDAGVATVNNGTVTIHRTGTVTITAKAGNASDSVNLTINHLKITLNGNEGLFNDNSEIREEIIETDSLTNKATYSLPAEEPTREHYQLNGWLRYGETRTVTGVIDISDNTTLTAVWDPIKPKIIENLSPEYYADHENGTDTVFTVSASGVDVHYRWQTKMPGDTDWTYVSNNDSTTYVPVLDASHDGMQVRCVVEDRWYSPATTAESVIATFYWGLYTITYDAGEGLFSSGLNMREESAALGQIYVLEGEEPTRSSYTFAGWELNGELVTDVVISGDMTVNARWEYEEPVEPLTASITNFEIHPYDPDFWIYYDWNGSQYSTGSDGNYVLGTFEFSRPLTEAEESSIYTYGSLRDIYYEDVYLNNYMVLLGTLDRDNMYVANGNESGVFMIDLTGVDSGTYTFELDCMIDQNWYSDEYEFVYDASIIPEPDPDSLVVTPDFSEITEAYVGNTVTLSVSVNQEDVSYEWFEEYPGCDYTEPLSTESYYTFTADDDMDGHYFTCRIHWQGQEEEAYTILNIVYPESQRPTSVTITAADNYQTIDGIEFMKISSDVEGGNGSLNYRWEQCYTLGDWYTADSWFENDQTCFYQTRESATGLFFRLKVNGVKSNVIYIPYGDEPVNGGSSAILISSDDTEFYLDSYNSYGFYMGIRCSAEISDSDDVHWWIKESYQDDYYDEFYPDYDQYEDKYYADISTFPNYWMYSDTGYDIMLEVNGEQSNELQINTHWTDVPHEESCPECGGMYGEHVPGCPMAEGF